jgi:subtilisin family serine protease
MIRTSSVLRADVQLPPVQLPHLLEDLMMRKLSVLLCAGAFALAPLAAVADPSYVLTASNWGAKQTAAVQAAGGTVVFSHGQAGIGIVTSNAPDFLTRVQASNAFQTAAADMMVKWQMDTPVQEITNPEQTAVTPGNDTFFPLQWAHTALNSQGAWSAGCTGAGARVAVIDGGIYSAHVDLAGAIDTACSTSFVPGKAFNNDVGTFWHGTHVAGIIAARDNGTGVIGVAPDATIIGVKALDNGSGSFGAVILGVLYAADPASFGAVNCQRADIINMSLGAVFPKTAAGSLIGALAKAINFAGSKGVLVLSAAGNNAIDFGQAGNYVDVPGDSGNGLAISATAPMAWAYGNTNFTRPASYSSYGEGYVTLAGPGGDFAYPGNETCTMPTATGTITTACWVFDMYLSTSRGTTAAGSYTWAAGTSMATPAAAGVAALIESRFPGISVGALKTRLQQSAVDAGKIGYDDFYGHGFVNAARACTQP